MSMLIAAWPATPSAMSPFDAAAARAGRARAARSTRCSGPRSGIDLEGGERVVVGDGDGRDGDHVVLSRRAPGRSSTCAASTSSSARPSGRSAVTSSGPLAPAPNCSSVSRVRAVRRRSPSGSDRAVGQAERASTAAGMATTSSAATVSDDVSDGAQRRHRLRAAAGVAASGLRRCCARARRPSTRVPSRPSSAGVRRDRR